MVQRNGARFGAGESHQWLVSIWNLRLGALIKKAINTTLAEPRSEDIQKIPDVSPHFEKLQKAHVIWMPSQERLENGQENLGFDIFSP